LRHEIEQREGRWFTFLTIVNAGAANINRERLRIEFPDIVRRLDAGEGVPGDPTCGGGNLIFTEGMRVRLTRNIDKDRGFVNGNSGIIERVLRKDVFIMKTFDNNMILVHPIRVDGQTFVPASYAYATTVRRAQGATLDLVGLYFDRKRCDRGYAYVGVSRAKRRADVYLIGNVRRTDWLPVGEDARGGEQHYLSALSESDSEGQSESSEHSSAFDSPSEDSGGRDLNAWAIDECDESSGSEFGEQHLCSDAWQHLGTDDEDDLQGLL
jgi:hypothetical protein